jgi:hypothetical protein
VRRFLVIAAMMLLIPAVVFAQAQTTGRVVGSVTDGDGNPVADAKVTFVSSALQGERVVKTADDGSFSAGLLPVGPYAVSIAAPGQKTVELSFRIGVGQTVPLNISLEAGEQMEERVTVYGTATAMETTAAGQNLSSDEVNNLPITDRRLANIASFAPNISFGPTGGASGTSTSISISGAPSYDTVVLLDGAEISDPYFGGGTTVYLEDAIEETQVLTAGVSARYGRFQGGVINAITKSGGNEFDASVRYNFWQQDWDSQSPAEESQSDELNETYQATVGGFILKDRLWFFGGYREIPGSSNTSLTSTTQESYTTSTIEERWQLKLKGAVSPNHVIEASHLEFEGGSTMRAGLPAGDLRAATGVRTDPRETTTMSYQGVLTPNMFLSLQATEKKASIISGASDIGLGSPILDWRGAFRVYKNHWWGGTSDPDQRDNETWGLNMNWVKSTGHGTHSLEWGVQGVNSITGGKNSQSATGYNFVANAGITGKEFVTGCIDAMGTPTGNPCTFNVDQGFDIERWNAPAVGVPAGGFEAEVENAAVYVQDTITAGSWRFDVGFRYEEYDGNGPFISETVSFDSLAPRLGVTYNIDDNWQIQGSWAQYTSRINDNVSNSVTFVGENPSQTEGYTGPIYNDLTYDEIELLVLDDAGFCGGEPNGTCWNTIKDRTDPNLPTTFLLPNLEAPHANDLNLAVKRRLPRNSGTLVLNYTNRSFNNLLDDFRGEACQYSSDPTCSNIVTLPDPTGGTNDTDVDATLWGNASQATRQYESVALTFDYRPSAKWNIGGNYTLSDTTGNYEGEGRNTPGSGSAIGNFVDSRPDAAAVPDGYLDEHIGNRARIWGNYRFDFGRAGNLSLGAIGTYQDGRTWSTTASVPYIDNPNYESDSGTFTWFFDGRGNNRFNSWYAFDLSANYNVKIWKKLDTFIQVQVLNVFDADELVAYDTDGSAALINGDPVPASIVGTAGEADIDGNGDGIIDGTGTWTFNQGASFGTARDEDDYQTPRRFRFSVGFRW